MTTTPRRKADSDLVTVEEFFSRSRRAEGRPDRRGDLYGLT